MNFDLQTNFEDGKSEMSVVFLQLSRFIYISVTIERLKCPKKVLLVTSLCWFVVQIRTMPNKNGIITVKQSDLALPTEAWIFKILVQWAHNSNVTLKNALALTVANIRPMYTQVDVQLTLHEIFHPDSTVPRFGQTGRCKNLMWCFPQSTVWTLPRTPAHLWLWNMRIDGAIFQCANTLT